MPSARLDRNTSPRETPLPRDLLVALRERLRPGDGEWDRLDTEATQVADAAVEFAKSGTDPAPAEALENVYAEGR